MVDAYNALLIRKEAVYATPVAPAAVNAVLTRNFKASPLLVDQIDRKLDRPSRGALPTTPSNRRQTLRFEVEIAGSGTAGTAPAWMELNECCGMAAPAITANTSAEQRFAAVNAAISSLTAYHFVGNQKRRGYGARGDITTIDFTAGAVPFLAYDFTALVPTNFLSVETPDVDYSRYQGPLEVNTANTSVSLDSYAVTMRSLRLQANAEVTLRNLVGANYVQRGNHALNGKLVIEAPSFTDKNFFSSLTAGRQIPFSIQHGTAAGAIVRMAAPQLQITAIADAVEDTVAMFELDVQLNISAGQDDLIITTA